MSPVRDIDFQIENFAQGYLWRHERDQHEFDQRNQFDADRRGSLLLPDRKKTPRMFVLKERPWSINR